MQISKSSWHFRFLNGFLNKPEYRIPRSLCPYVRMLLFNLFMVGLLAVAVSNILIASVWSWYALFFLPEGIVPSDIGHVYIALGIVAQAVALITGGVIGWAEWGDDLLDWLGNVVNKTFPPKPSNFTGVAKPKTPSVFWEYVKARKKKLCPLIEFTE